MYGYRRFLLLAVVPALMLQAGCANLPALLPGQDVNPTEETEAVPDTAPAELPPRQAARACLATARALEQKGYDTQAIAQYERARQNDPHLQVARRLAVLYDRQGDYEHAQVEYDKALQATRTGAGPLARWFGPTHEDADLLNDVGYFYYEQHNWDKAEKYLRRALTANPGYQRAWVNLGLVLGHEERFEESYQAFAKAVGPAEARSNVGIILAKLGHKDEAEAAFRQALAQKPDLKQARVFLETLEHPPSAADRATPRAEAAGDSGVSMTSLCPPS